MSADSRKPTTRQGSLGESGKQKRILIVDDDTAQCQMMAALLGGGGYLTLTAFTGEQGLETYKVERPDMLIVDFAMPGMNGIEMVNAIRELETSRKPLVLMVAGYAQSFLAALDQSVGVDSYLLKPILPAELLTRVADLFAGRY